MWTIQDELERRSPAEGQSAALDTDTWHMPLMLPGLLLTKNTEIGDFTMVFCACSTMVLVPSLYC